MSKFDYKGFLKDNPLLKEIEADHVSEFFRKKKAEPEVEDDDEKVAYPEVKSVNGFTLVLNNKNQIGDGYYYITKGFKNLYESGKIRIALDKSAGKIFVKVDDSINGIKLVELEQRVAGLLEKLDIEVHYTTPSAPADVAYSSTYPDYISEDEDRADILNRLRQSVKDDRDDEDEDEDGIEVGTEPEEAPKPKRSSAADRKAKNRAKYQDRVKANREKRQKDSTAALEKNSNILLSNRHSINAYTGRIFALDGSGNVYDSIDDAPAYFLNTLKDRDKHIIWQVTNKRLEEDLQGKDVNALALVTLDSVGHYLDIDTAEVYPINADDTPDFKNAFSLHDEIDEEFINALSERDRLVVAKYTDQVM